jgi:hypothetical protein
MDIIGKDKERAVDGYFGASGDQKTARRLLMQAATDPDAEFTMTPRGMKSFADLMLKIERIKQNPANWQEMFYNEQPSCREATIGTAYLCRSPRDRFK